MKKLSKNQTSLRKKQEANNARTPTAMHSILFSHSKKNATESVVVPETPNNSYHNLPSDMDTTGGTVLETPDTPPNVRGNLQRNAAENTVSRSSGIDISEKTFEELLAKCAREKVNDEDAVLSDEEDNPILNVTPELNLGRRKNVMSILESEHSFAQSLQSQRSKNSSMVPENKLYYPNVSPVKRRKRKSLAQVVLPFDLNDTHTMSNKLHSIKEMGEMTRKVKGNRRSYCVSKTTKSKINSMAKSRMSIQFSDLNLRDATAPRGVHRFATNQEKLTANRCANETGNNGSTLFFENEDLDLTAIESINESVCDIIKGLASQNLLDGEREGCDNTAGPSICWKDQLLQQDEIHLDKPQTSSGNADDVNDSRASISSADLLPTQPASILILQGVVAYVEVRIGSDNRSEAIKDQLRTLGARVREKLTSDVTHVIFKDGNKATFKRAKKRGLHLVSSLWIEACRENFKRMSEALFPSGSMESYMNPCLPTKLRKLKSMQPKDFTEEERIATARARRKKKCIAQSPPLEELGYLTPKRNSTAVEDVNSPLFGIGHLLTPQRRSSESQSSSEEAEGTLGDDCLDTTFATPLTKRLYNRFLTPQRLKSLSQRSGDLSELSLESTSADSSKEVPENTQKKLNEKQIAVQIHSKNINDGNNENSLMVSSLLLSTESTSRTAIESEIPVVSDSHQRMQNLLKPRRSQRLSQRFNLQKHSKITQCGEIDEQYTDDNSPQFSKRTFKKHRVYTSTSEHVDQYSGSNTSSASEKSFVNGVGDQNNKLTNLDNIPLSSCDRIATHKQPKQKNEIHQVRKSVMKENRKSSSGKMKKTVLTKNHDTGGALSAIVKAENVACMRDGKQLPHGSEASTSDSMSTIWDEEPLCSSSSTSQKTKGRKLLSVDCMGPSQDLIVPTTPLHSRCVSLGPYATLLVKGSKTQRAALRELKDYDGKCRTKLKRRGTKKRLSIQRKGRENRISVDFKHSTSSQSSSQSSGVSLDDVFFSPDEERTDLRTKIFPLPRTRKSIEEFVIKKKPSRMQKQSSQKSFSISLTSFHSKERKYIIPIIRKLGRCDITEGVDSTTTHVICGAERRTLNVLFGIARGTWIMDKSWLYESLEMQKWAPEEPFEIFTYCPGAKICRKQRETQGASYKQTLFSGIGSVCVLDGCEPPSQELRDLLTLCGCEVVANVRNANLIVCNPTLCSGVKKRICQVPRVSEKWILDSVQYHKITNIYDYAVIGNSGSSIT